MMKKYLLALLLLNVFIIESKAQTQYYPPAAPQNWDTISPLSLNWCPNKIDSLFFNDRRRTL
jgi:hypothetical protein